MDDLVEYLENSSGKHILGTYASFYHQEGNPTQPHIYDNRKLARVFGFDPSLSYTTKKLSSQPKILSNGFVVAAHQQSTQQAITNVIKTGQNTKTVN